MATIRSYRPGDAAAFTALYNSARPIAFAPLSVERLASWFDDPALDPSRDVWVAEDDQGDLLGAVALFPWAEPLAEGRVFLMGPFVRPAARRQGLAARLVAVARDAVAARYPGARLQMRVDGVAPEAEAFLSACGFSRDRRFCVMQRDLEAPLPRVEELPGYRFSHLWPGDDPAEALALYRTILDSPEPGARLLTAEDLERYAELDRFAPDSFLVVRDSEGAAVAMSFTAFPPGPEAEIVFLGVLPPHRGKGLAHQLVARALHAAADRGCARVRLEASLGGNERTPGLYEALGFVCASQETYFEAEAGALSLPSA